MRLLYHCGRNDGVRRHGNGDATDEKACSSRAELGRYKSDIRPHRSANATRRHSSARECGRYRQEKAGIVGRRGPTLHKRKGLD